MALFPQPTPGVPPPRRMIVCGDDALAERLAAELTAVYREWVTLVVPAGHRAGPAFAGAMMGRQILGAVPVERRVLLFAALNVAGNPQLEGHTIAESFRPGAWRVLALDTAEPDERLQRF